MPPCDTKGECPYTPLSPGEEGALDPRNFRAVWLWERLRSVGPLALELLDWHLTPAEAELLLEQLHVLTIYSAAQAADTTPTHAS